MSEAEKDKQDLLKKGPGDGGETKKSFTGKNYEPHGHNDEKKKPIISCDPKRPSPNDILERAIHFDVNAKGRKCTDCYCCFVYLFFILGWVIVAAIAMYFGNIYALVYGRDYQDFVCGTETPRDYKWWENPSHEWGLDKPRDFRKKKYLYYPRLNDDLIDHAILVGSTVKDLDVYNMDIEALLNITLLGVCVEHCPIYGEVVCTNDYELGIHQDYYNKHGVLCDQAKDGECKPTANSVGKCRGGELLFGLIKNPFYYTNTELCSNCWVTPLNTTEIFFRCLEVIWTQDTKTEKCLWPKSEKEVDGVMVPLKPGEKGYLYAEDDDCITKEVIDIEFSEQPAYDNPVAEMLGDALSTLQGWITDLYNAIYVILIMGCAVSVLLGFLWIFLLRWLTKPIVWGTIVVFLLVMFVGAGWAWLNTGWIPSEIIAIWLADSFTTLGISHPILDYIVTSLNTTEPGNLTLAPDNPVTRAVGQTLPYDLDSAGTIDIETLWRVGAITATVLLIAGVVVVIILAKKIAIAIAIIEEAAIAVMRMPHMVFLPFVTAACILATFLWFVFMGALISSLEDLKVADLIDSLSGFVSDNLGDCNSTNITSHLVLGANMFNSDPIVDTNTTMDLNASTTTGTTTTATLNAVLDKILDKIPVEVKVPDKVAEAACNGLHYFNRWGDKSMNDALLIFHLFCFLWTNELLQAITICIVAGAVCDWYWTRPSGPKKHKIFNPDGPDPKRAFKGGDGKSFQFPLLRSARRTFQFHLGSLAFGSFLVACVQLLRILFEYLKKQTRGWAQRNKCFKILFKVITIILMCFEKCLKFITKNAYIMVAMQGHAFCDSCCHAFKLLLTNLVQFVLVSCFSKVVITLGKITIMGSGVVGAYFWLSRDPVFTEWTPTSVNDEWDGIQGARTVNNKFLPVVLVGLLGYLCASAFLHVYDLAIASILLCFCEDFKVHQVADPHFSALHKEVYMPNSLRRIVLSPTEFAHMQKPMTQEEIMAMAGVDCRSDKEKAFLTRDEILQICKNILVKSDEFLHLHKAENKLTAQELITMTGGKALEARMRRKNPQYNKEFALDVREGREHVKGDFHDPRLEKFEPELNQTELLNIIRTEGHLESHMHPLTHEEMTKHAEDLHGPEVATAMNNSIPSRQKIASRSAKKDARRAKKGQGKSAVAPSDETPVTYPTSELKKENSEDNTFVKDEAIL